MSESDKNRLEMKREIVAYTTVDIAALNLVIRGKRVRQLLQKIDCNNYNE